MYDAACEDERKATRPVHQLPRSSWRRSIWSLARRVHWRTQTRPQSIGAIRAALAVRPILLLVRGRDRGGWGPKFISRAET